MIGERLKKERERLGYTQPDFAEHAGAKKRTLIDWEKGVSSPTSVQLSALSKIGVDVQFVITGKTKIERRLDAMENATKFVLDMPVASERKMLLRDILFATEAEDFELLGQLLNIAIKEDTALLAHETDYHEIPHYNIQAAAGSGVIPLEEMQLRPLAFRIDWLAKRHLSPNNLFIVDVKGESMEPKLLDGDLVLVDKSQKDIASGKTYVLRVDGHLLVKNLQLLPGGLVQVASYNNGFPPYQVNLADEALDMAVIGRVVASMHEW
jgi:transcriptional regulator with XRE-family HTH domain